MTEKSRRPGRIPFVICPVGHVERGDASARLHVYEAYRACLRELETFSHAEVLWWFSECDDEHIRGTTQVDPPFAAPTLGVFASHAPTRPNPLAVSTTPIRGVEAGGGIVSIGAIDALDGSPIVDIRPYLPHYSRVQAPSLPGWASGWPMWMPEDGVELDQSPG